MIYDPIKKHICAQREYKKSILKWKRTHFIWTEKISKKHFEIKYLDIKNLYWYTKVMSTQGKQISGGLKEYQIHISN